MSNEGSGGSNNRTIKDLADEVRVRALSAMSGSDFAKLCMEFDDQIRPGNAYVRYIRVLQRFEADSRNKADLQVTTRLYQ